MYISTRSNFNKVLASEAIKMGMVPTGGLFVPEVIPALKDAEINNFSNKTYSEITESIFSLYLDDYSLEEIRGCIDRAYNQNNFDHKELAPLHKLNDHTFILELWHGPTAAFKDMALQMLPQLLSLAIKKTGVDKEIVILVATSGDTGKAALEGFKNVEGTKIIAFYPNGGVSKIQEVQMNTTEGKNTYVVGVDGNFDDCQTAVKKIFADNSFKELLATKGFELSSANSINWGRLLPQVVYYFKAYSELLKTDKIKEGEKINFVVPTGNFGNILAGWYAYKMGLPVNKFICASNENKVLTDFFKTGVYDREREFKKTNSPSMDILVSSNLERFLFEITGHDGEKISKWMNDLNTKGSFEIDKETKEKIDEIMLGGYADEKETEETINSVSKNNKYTMDTHTAVALKVYKDYKEATKDETKTVIDSTASPFKFNESVLEAMGQKVEGLNEFKLLDKLSEVSGLDIHFGLKNLDQKPILHNRKCEKENIKNSIEEILAIR